MLVYGLGYRLQGYDKDGCKGSYSQGVLRVQAESTCIMHGLGYHGCGTQGMFVVQDCRFVVDGYNGCLAQAFGIIIF